MRQPEVSVIIPSFMEEKYIGGAFRALGLQTYKNVETIVSDSSSTDRTIEIARKLADKVVVTKQRGISLGRNMGAKAAHGDILLFMDADTELVPDFIEKIVGAFSDPKVVMAAGMIRAEGNWSARFIFRATGELAWILSKIGRPKVYGMCMAVRKDVYDKLHGFDERLETAEDIDFTHRASKLGRCIVVRGAIAYTSPRRLRMGRGAISAVWYHIANYLRYRFLGKSAKAYPVIR